MVRTSELMGFRSDSLPRWAERKVLEHARLMREGMTEIGTTNEKGKAALAKAYKTLYGSADALKADLEGILRLSDALGEITGGD